MARSSPKRVRETPCQRHLPSWASTQGPSSLTDLSKASGSERQRFSIHNLIIQSGPVAAGCTQPRLRHTGYRLVKEEMSGLPLPPPPKSQGTVEGNLLQAATTLQAPASQQRPHPRCFYFLFPVLKIWSELVLNYSVAGHHQEDNVTKKNKDTKVLVSQQGSDVSRHQDRNSDTWTTCAATNSRLYVTSMLSAREKSSSSRARTLILPNTPSVNREVSYKPHQNFHRPSARATPPESGTCCTWLFLLLGRMDAHVNSARPANVDHESALFFLFVRNVGL